MRTRKILAAFLATMMITVMMPVSVTAEEYTDGYYTYTVTDGKATIIDVDETISGDVVIPDILGGCPVTAIGDCAFSDCTSLTIHCYYNSVAHKYAVDNNIPYNLLDAISNPGDATGDGSINLSDVTLILKHIAKWDVTVDADVADVTGDGSVNLSDVTLILKYIAKWDVTLG